MRNAEFGLQNAPMKQELEARTKGFALAVIVAVGELRKSKAADVISYQLLKSGTSIGANYSTCEIGNDLRLRPPLNRRF